MMHAKTFTGTVHAAAPSAKKSQPMIALVETMSQEIKRLDEDNAQLRAAIAMYRDALERYTGRPTPSA